MLSRAIGPRRGLLLWWAGWGGRGKGLVCATAHPAPLPSRPRDIPPVLKSLNVLLKNSNFRLRLISCCLSLASLLLETDSRDQVALFQSLIRVDKGQSRRWEVIITPAHAAEHVSYFIAFNIYNKYFCSYFRNEETKLRFSRIK